MSRTRQLKLALLGTSLVAAIGCGTAHNDQPNSPERRPNTLGNMVSLINPASWAIYQQYQPQQAAVARNSAWGPYMVTHYVMMDAGYVETLRIRAEAALVEARAKAKRDQAVASALSSVESEVNAEIASLKAQIADMDARQARVYAEAMRVARLNTGDATPENIASINYLVTLAGASLSRLAAVRVPSLPADQFTSRGSWRVEVTPDGQRIFRRNEAIAFGGGNGLEYLDFLKSARQNPRSGKQAHLSIVDITDVVATIGLEWNTAIEKRKDDIHTKKVASLQKLIDLITALEKR